MRVVSRAEFRDMLRRALWKLPAAMRPKHVDAAAHCMTRQPPLDQLEFRIRSAMDFGDMQPKLKQDDEGDADG